MRPRRSASSLATWNAQRCARAAGAGREDGALPGPARRRGGRSSDLYREIEAFDLWFTIQHEPDRRASASARSSSSRSRCRTSASSSSGSTSRTTRSCGSGSRWASSASSRCSSCSRRAVQLGARSVLAVRIGRARRRRRRRARLRRDVPRLRLRRHRVGRPQHRVPRRRLRPLRRLRRWPTTTGAGRGACTGAASRWCRSERARGRAWRVAAVAAVAGGAAVARGDDDARPRHAPADRRRPGADGAGTDGAPATGTTAPAATPAPPTARRRRSRSTPSTPGDADQPADPRRLEHAHAPTSCADAGMQLNSWGGNPSTRYNYEIGHAWNHGADYEFRNTNYGDTRRRGARRSLDDNAAAGVADPAGRADARLGRHERRRRTRARSPTATAVPAGDRGRQLRRTRRPVADPTTANVESTPEQVADVGAAAWSPTGSTSEFIAMDNEPELWGYTHYDVHPECPTYEEILDKYLDLRRRRCATSRRTPSSTGPGDVLLVRLLEHRARARRRRRTRTSCAGSCDSVQGARRRRPAAARSTSSTCTSTRRATCSTTTTDAETNARRLRSTRSLWDPDYIDESWIDEPIEFIPRMQARRSTSHYPGTAAVRSRSGTSAPTRR